MSEKTPKYYISDRKEIFVFFIIMILISLLSFVFGVKFGLNYSFSKAGLTQEDIRNVELMSEREEKVKEQLSEFEKNDHQGSEVPSSETSQAHQDGQGEGERDVASAAAHGASADLIEKNLKKALADAASGTESTGHEVISKKEIPVNPLASTGGPEADGEAKVDPYAGKFTIQIGAYRALDEAKMFAEGFKQRGYNCIINKADLDGQTWYRVSIGSFASVSETTDYIKSNQTLFAGQENRIVKFE